MRCRDPVKSARSDAERLRRVMVEGIRASDEPVCGAEGQGSTWWSGRWRAVLSHDASFGQDERQNLQPRQDCHQHADQPKKTKLVVVHLNLQRGSGFRLKSVQERNQSMEDDWREGRAQRKSYEISRVHAYRSMLKHLRSSAPPHRGPPQLMSSGQKNPKVWTRGTPHRWDHGWVPNPQSC